jgi:hypothetical protein
MRKSYRYFVAKANLALGAIDNWIEVNIIEYYWYKLTGKCVMKTKGLKPYGIFGKTISGENKIADRKGHK